jgi:hypothetical protein
LILRAQVDRRVGFSQTNVCEKEALSGVPSIPQTQRLSGQKWATANGIAIRGCAQLQRLALITT